MEEIPAYRNPKNLPAKVFCVDIRGGKISPVWSSEIMDLAVRSWNGKILTARYSPNFESYQDKAIKHAKEIVLEMDLSQDPNNPQLISRRTAVEIIALNNNGEIYDILWSSSSNSRSLDLEQRILQKRKRIHRFWQEGEALASEWSISSGLNLIIRNDPNDPQNNSSIVFPLLK